MSESLANASAPTTATAPTVLATACPFDCPDACSLEARVEEGRVVKLDGSRTNPLTEGYICTKVRRFPDAVYGPDRLLHPVRRIGPKGEGRFERIGWDEALGTIAERMLSIRASGGGEGILPLAYGGSNGLFTHEAVDSRLFRRLGASRLGRTVCAAPTRRVATALYGRMAGTALQDYVHSRLIVVWGTNPSATGIHLIPPIQEARKAGATLVVIDPRTTPLAKQADLHLAVKPGTDLAVAMSLHRFLFTEGKIDLEFLNAYAEGWEEIGRRAEPWTFERAGDVAGVPAADVERFARLYAETSPAVIRVGWGSERNRNGGSATAAIMALPAVAGKFGVRGGGYTQSNSGIWDLDGDGLIAEPEAKTRLINMNRIGEALAEAAPPVELLFVYNCNPLMTLPNQERVRRGLLRDDLFTVVFDPFLTDTALYADVALPATTFLEHAELDRGYGAMLLQDAPAVADRVGESRPNYEVFGELIERLGLAKEGDATTPAAMRAQLLSRDSRVASDLDRDGIAFPPAGPAPIQFVDEFPRTPDRKVHLCPADLDREAPGGLYSFRDNPSSPGFPLTLVSPASDRMITSSLGQLVKRDARLEIHPQDAARRSLANGDAVRIWNDYGEVHCHARVTREVRPGVCALPKGLWARHTGNGATANALAPDSLTDLGGGACFNDARIEVARLD
ncbi:MAG TPA: molybdopterin-dependent oxidoreductase [Thermoanaerobaculia bacterium]|nr:molybdopterin-dependent oxidoreductase [Thermoanaerobaculia bacterium]